MKTKSIAYLLVFWSLVACDQRLMDGWSKLTDDTYYKIHYLGEGEQKAQRGDDLYAQIAIYGASGKQLYSNNLSSGAMHRFKVSGSSSLWNKVFGVLHEGDSATFITDGSTVNLNKLTKGVITEYPHEITISVKLWRILNAKEKRDTAVRTVSDDYELLELKQLSDYFEAKGIDKEALYVDGIYFQRLNAGSDKRALSGDNVWINYIGYFLDGTEFDNTYKRGQMLDFQLGKPDQVIRGFEIALSKMHQGEKVRLYLTSAFAFGEKGASNGQVKPYTPVIFDLKLEQIRN